ncbi:MAG: MMPL family transporter [Solirubrobacteraceae bacterium]
MRKLATWCFRHRIVTIVAWILTLVVLNGLHGAAGSAYTDNFKLPHTESFDAIRLLQKASPKASGETDQLVIAVNHGKVTDPAVKAQAAKVFAAVAKVPHVSAVISPYTPLTSKQIAPGGQVAFANVQFDNAANRNKITAPAAQHFVKTITSGSSGGVQFQVEGNIAQAGNPTNQSSSLFFGFIAAAIVLFIAFGSFTAMFLPLVTAGVSLGSAIAVVGLLSHLIDIATFSNELALLIGLGVGVDYALFIVTRYRQALLRGVSREDAVVQSLDTSGRAVLFAGMIVCIAMLGMFALGVSFLYGVAVAATVTVAFTVLASLTLLPALLGVFGKWVPRRRERKAVRGGELRRNDESPIWARWTGIMSKRPAVFATLAALAMIIIALPFFGMRLGSADAGTDPSSTTTRKAYDLLAKGFGPGYNGPLQLVAKIDSRAQLASFSKAEQAVAGTPGVVGSTPARVIRGTAPGAPSVAIANVYPKGSPQAASTSDLLHQIRGSVIPAATRGSGMHVLVGGTTAIFDDFSHVLSSKLPLFIGIVVVLSFLLLMAVFRSLVIPLTAAVMNMLSVGAAFGVLTAVFQHGWGASIIGLNTTGPIEAFIPVLLFPILFGLSMDYEVFLISRIYEEWHRRGDNREAVTHGLSANGRTIPAAAAIMVLVFGSFVLGGEWIIEMFGIGLASAVLLDALIVRSVLVPALMILIGDSNWKLPGWLDRMIPHLNVEGSVESSERVVDAPQRPTPEPVAG